MTMRDVTHGPIDAAKDSTLREQLSVAGWQPPLEQTVPTLRAVPGIQLLSGFGEWCPVKAAKQVSPEELIENLGKAKFADRQNTSKAVAAILANAFGRDSANISPAQQQESEDLAVKVFRLLAKAVVDCNEDPAVSKPGISKRERNTRAQNLLDKSFPSQENKSREVITKVCETGLKSAEGDYKTLIKGNDDLIANKALRTRLVDELRGLAIPEGTPLAGIARQLKEPEKDGAAIRMEYALDVCRANPPLKQGTNDKAIRLLTEALQLNHELSDDKRFLKIAALAGAADDTKFVKLLEQPKAIEKDNLQLESKKIEKNSLQELKRYQESYRGIQAESDPDISRYSDFLY